MAGHDESSSAPLENLFGEIVHLADVVADAAWPIFERVLYGVKDLVDGMQDESGK